MGNFANTAFAVILLTFICFTPNQVQGQGNCNNGPATINCTSFTVGCNGPLFQSAATSLEAICPILTGKSLVQYAVAAGCYCANNGLGPSCPAWLTCPPGVSGTLVLAGYNLENIFTNNMCHCQCSTTECPAFTL